MTTTLNASTAGVGGFIATSDNSGSLALQTAGTTAITVSASQQVGVGATPSATLQVFCQDSVSGKAIRAAYDGTYYSDYTENAINCYNNNYNINVKSGSNLIFKTADTERMRINSSGNLLVGATSGVGSEKINVTQTASDWVGQFVNNNATQAYCIRASTGTYYFNTSSLLYDGLDFGNLRFRVYTNGGIANYSANNSNLSDQREKKDIEFAPNYLNKICQIPVKTFFYNQQTDTEKNLGAIAQDVQAICPELVTESNWGTEQEPKMRLSIYQTDLQYALMKSIQELKAINDTQAETINALTARIVALEGQ
jgi:hypothetical protein